MDGVDRGLTIKLEGNGVTLSTGPVVEHRPRQVGCPGEYVM